MTRIEACKIILTKMKEAGHEDIIPVEWVDSWSNEEIDYHLVNYGTWLTPEDFPAHVLFFKFMQENVH